jgi:SAM-dependent methyltransferase
VSAESVSAIEGTTEPRVSASYDGGYIDWKSWNGDDFGHIDAIEHAYFAVEVPIPVPAEARVLEVGYGNGAFLAWSRSLGADTFGVEANPELVARAREFLGGKQAFGSIFDPELDAFCGSFTHIVAFDVLEHIPQSEYPALFGRFAALGAAGVSVTLRFPNGDSPFGRASQHGDPTHVTTIGRAKLTYFAQRAGFAVEAIRAPAMPLTGIGWRRALRRRLVLALRSGLESLIGQLYFGRRIAFDQNYTAVLVRRR